MHFVLPNLYLSAKLYWFYQQKTVTAWKGEMEIEFESMKHGLLIVSLVFDPLAILCTPPRIMCAAPLCRGNTLASSAMNSPSLTQTHRRWFLYTLKPDTVLCLIHNSEKRDLKCHNHITHLFARREEPVRIYTLTLCVKWKPQTHWDIWT